MLLGSDASPQLARFLAAAFCSACSVHFEALACSHSRLCSSSAFADACQRSPSEGRPRDETKILNAQLAQLCSLLHSPTFWSSRRSLLRSSDDVEKVAGVALDIETLKRVALSLSLSLSLSCSTTTESLIKNDGLHGSSTQRRGSSLSTRTVSLPSLVRLTDRKSVV